MFRVAESGGAWYIRNMSTSTNIYTVANLATASVLRGAYHGAQLCFVDDSGVARIADDGATFAGGLTWQKGTIVPALLAGGERLVWLALQAAISNEFARISYDGFASTYTAMTGNFWTELYSDQFNLGDYSLIYRQ